VNLPNCLTFGRILATPVIAVLAAADQPLAAAALFALAGATDWLDGYLARKLDQATALGAMFDPIADKLQVGVILGVLLWLGALAGWHALPALAILAREIFVSGLREAMAGLGADRIPSSFAAKAKTTAQMGALAMLLLAPAVPESGVRNLGLALLWAAAALSLWTGVVYLKSALRTVRP